MNWKNVFLCAVALAGVGLFSSTATAQEFEPFSQVENVCPDCEQSKADVVEMSNGDAIRGTVVAENTDFYVIVRYGEVRAVPRSDVQAIEWAGGNKPSGLMKKHQILLKNGHVLSGTITEEKDKPAIFKIKSSFSQQSFTVFKKEVKTAYKDGQTYSFSMPEDKDE
ncbi:MAG: hypothetical protein ACQEVA_13975 [Myxococcota bacterium]